MRNLYTTPYLNPFLVRRGCCASGNHLNKTTKDIVCDLWCRLSVMGLICIAAHADNKKLYVGDNSCVLGNLIPFDGMNSSLYEIFFNKASLHYENL